MTQLSARRPGLPGRRVLALAVLAVLWCAAALLPGAPPAAAAGALGTPVWTVSSATTGATGTSYQYTFTAATTSSLSSVTMTVPAGTGGTPAVGAVRPLGLVGGTIALASNTLTYSFTAVTVAVGTFISIRVTGLANTSTASSGNTATITTRTGATAVDSGTSTPPVVFANTALVSPAWTVSSTAVGATGVIYTYTFTTPAAVLGTITSVTMTLPPGTGGTPTLGTVTPGGLLGGSLSRSGSTLTYTGISLLLLGATSVSIQVTGVTNTATAGSYTSEISVTGLLAPLLYSGITPAVSLAGPLSLTSPGALGWTAALTGHNQSAVDGTAGHQQFTIDDETNTAVGWHITVAATTFTTGTVTLPNAGTFVLTGSVTSATATTGPTVACVVSCVPPGNTTTYPAAITTAASAPIPATVFDAPANTGLGPVLIGGSAAARPVGWWINIPAGARAGSYTSTVTVAVISGP
jgi:hypothetical protein